MKWVHCNFCAIFFRHFNQTTTNKLAKPPDTHTCTPNFIQTDTYISSKNAFVQNRFNLENFLAVFGRINWYDWCGGIIFFARRLSPWHFFPFFFSHRCRSFYLMLLLGLLFSLKCWTFWMTLLCSMTFLSDTKQRFSNRFNTNFRCFHLTIHIRDILVK